jgi:CRP-like cAMP-binding protein
MMGNSVDNKWIENQIRPIAIGRSNWLFAASLRAGQRAATVMSLIQSARMNGHDPYAYLRCDGTPAHAARQSDRCAAATPLAANPGHLTLDLADGEFYRQRSHTQSLGTAPSLKATSVFDLNICSVPDRAVNRTGLQSVRERKTSCLANLAGSLREGFSRVSGLPMDNAENHLLERLPKALRKRFLALCNPFELVALSDLSVHGAPLSHAYFPRSGFIALVIDIETHPPLAVGMIGPESMLGAELVLGVAKTPWRAVVQGAGNCWRLEAHVLRKTMATMPELRELVQGSLMVRLHQQSLATACQRFHSVSERLARWLLMSQDRAQADRFHVTQDFIAQMLGVRRVGVSGAASEFQRRGLIEYHRGELTVLDRLGLQQAACNCYAADKRLLNELMPSGS